MVRDFRISMTKVDCAEGAIMYSSGGSFYHAASPLMASSYTFVHTVNTNSFYFLQYEWRAQAARQISNRVIISVNTARSEYVTLFMDAKLNALRASLCYA